MLINPRFDIILPTVGRESLGQAVRSVISQSYGAWNLHVVCDRSRVGQDYIEKQKKVFGDRRIWWSSIFPDKPGVDNSNGTDARNLAIESGTAPWVAYIDDDDEWLPHHLDTLVKMSQENHNLLHTRGRMVKWKQNSPRSKRRYGKFRQSLHKKTVRTFDEPTTVGMSHTRELFVRTRGWQPVDNHDHILFQEMIDAGARVKISEETTYEFTR